MDKNTPNKYGIPVVKRQKVRPAKPLVNSGKLNPGTIDTAKKIIAEHRAVLHALAKR
ncbi:hypothetical protein [Dyella sp.]|uniref:hypothetical protein n=1 Tax=Dyella sp. TaxID=1869338 RepID=UPI002B46C636|nr:hypothetical protein [Dyella sp.]HKT29429.1 hypothetical protein [Dyella sp.]